MNQKKKVLLLCDPRSVYVTQFIENVLEPMDMEIYIQNNLNGCNEETKIFYKTHGVRLLKCYDQQSCKIFSIPKIGWRISFLLNLFVLKKNKDFDYVHIEFVTKQALLSALIVKNQKIKRFASFFGSDLLRNSLRYLKSEKKYLDQMDYISADSYLMKTKYNSVYRSPKNDLNVIYYGVTLFDYIDKYYLKKEECKQFFDMPLRKKIVSIGYNARKEQQHDKVLQSLFNVKNKSDYFLLFQITYSMSSNETYIQELQEMIKKSGFEYKMITDFLSIDNLAKLRIASDIFINAQTTDAFCNSIKEYMYTKTQIISASWLHYPEIDLFPLHINEFKDFSEISVLLEKPITEEELEWNKNKIKQESTWASCREKWSEIYGINNQ